MNPRKHQLYV